MKKAVSIICALAMILSLNVASYSQSGQQTVTSPIALSDVNPYRIAPIEPESATIKYINNEESYVDTPIEKMGVGIMNTATSWAEVPAKISEVSEKDNNLLLGFTLGLGEGIVYGLARGASGIADTATFGMPPYDKPMMEPEYKVDNPDKNFKVDILSW